MNEKFNLNAFLSDFVECAGNESAMLDLLYRAHSMKRFNLSIGDIQLNGVFSALERAIKTGVLRSASKTIGYATKRIDIMSDLLNCFIAFTEMNEHCAMPIPKEETINIAKVLRDCYETFNIVDNIIHGGSFPEYRKPDKHNRQ